MTGCVFLAGASGVIGRALAPMLIADGWRVVGTTRAPQKIGALRALGVQPVIVDVFDAQGLRDAVARAAPAVVVHQLTDLPPGLDPRAWRTRVRATRGSGGRHAHLVAAAVHAGARRLVAQSLAFVYAPGPTPHGEDDPLDIAAEGRVGLAARAVASLERQVLTAPLHGSSCAMAGSTDPAPASMRRPAPARCTWRRRRRRPVWPLRAANRHLQHRRGRWLGQHHEGATGPWLERGRGIRRLICFGELPSRRLDVLK